MISVIFVCLGNICRSPMADGVFSKLVENAGLQHQINIDSAGTEGYHIGEGAHRGTRKVLVRHNIQYNGRARKIEQRDLQQFDYIIALDESNLSDLQWFDRRGQYRHKFYKLLDFAQNTTVRDVPDPYYSNNFEYVYELVLEGCRGLLAHIQAEHNL